jgi:hypothetical protein
LGLRDTVGTFEIVWLDLFIGHCEDASRLARPRP